MMCSGPFSGAQGHSNLQPRTDTRVRSSEPCSSSPDKVWPDGVVPSCATPLPGSIAATDHGVAGLSVASETGTLVRPRGPNCCASLHSPQRGYVASDVGGVSGYPNNSANRADDLGAPASSGVARRRRTCEIHQGDQHHFPRRPHESGEPQGSHGPTVGPRPCGSEAPVAGG